MIVDQRPLQPGAPGILSLSLLAILTTSPLVAASAAPVDSSSATELPAVLVTASKRGTTAFDTPSGLDVVTAAELDALRPAHVGEIAERQSNVYLTMFTANNPQLTIRGLGFSDDESDSVSNSVVIDGVPVYMQALGHPFDVEQIEVLRGPQSTLYGLNSMGGLLAVRTRDPGFAFAGSASAEYATGNRRRGELALDLPVSTTTALRLSGGVEHADGYIDNRTLHRDDTANWRTSFGRLKLLHRDRAEGELRLALERVQSHGGNDYFANRELAAQHRSESADAGRNGIAHDLLTGEYRRPLNETLESVTTFGYYRYQWHYWVPTSLFGGPSGYDMEGRQYSLESRLSRRETGGDWMLGVFLLHMQRDAPYLFDLRPYYLSSTTSDVEGRTAAVFGERGWRLGTSWRVAASLRLEYNRRRLNWSSLQGGYYDSDGDGVADTAYEGTDYVRGRVVHDREWLPRLTLEHRPDPRRYGWLTLARGYKASGFNIFATDAAAAARAYDPEYGEYVELGYRLRASDDAWSLAADVFHLRLRDQQVIVLGDEGQTLTGNAGRSHSRGVELEGSWRPTAALQMRVRAAWLDAEYDRYRLGTTDYAGLDFSAAPRHSYGVAVQWTPGERWRLDLAGNRQGRTRLYGDSSVFSPAYTLVDASLAYRLGDWTVAVFGKNLTDADYYLRAMSASALVAAAPRTVGVRVAWDF